MFGLSWLLLSQQLVLPDGARILDGPSGRFDRAADAVGLAAKVDKPADGTAGWIIDACYTAGAERDEFLRCCWSGKGEEGCQQGTRKLRSRPHACTLPILIVVLPRVEVLPRMIFLSPVAVCPVDFA